MINTLISPPDFSKDTRRISININNYLAVITPIVTGRLISNWQVYDIDRKILVRNFTRYATYVDRRRQLVERAVSYAISTERTITRPPTTF
jgi:hypothetical protein